jgi:hypothetical protein
VKSAESYSIRPDVENARRDTMNTKPLIKVIKLAERKRRTRARVKQERVSARPLRQDEARSAAAATVTGWVDELRREKQHAADTQGDFNSLFEDPA